MRISNSNWMQVEAFLKSDDRCVLPLGCTEQHAYLSLSTDSILAETVSFEAAEPLGIPVFPVLAYGVTPSFLAYPGTVSIRLSTYMLVLQDVLDSLYQTGFRRILIVNGHGGNIPARTLLFEWIANNADAEVTWHDWWSAERVWATVQEIDPMASHASWMENFPWTRLEGVTMPDGVKPMVERTRPLPPAEAREHIGDGSYGGRYQRSDEEMDRIWKVAIEETRNLLI